MSIPTKQENPEGLHQKYIISKTNGEPIDEGAEYFILRLDKKGGDKNHQHASRQAILLYATMIRPHIPQLAEDIFNKYGY